ncbi:MAG: hypothetical protein IJP92_14310, partial [Lachnospiraceae bacterium]|nr:hypothetical protein [Lachnospiraceae bacterium]
LYRFTDINEDGYEDLEVTASGETYRCFYAAKTEEFQAAPEVLNRAVSFRYDAGTGYLVVTERQAEGYEERALYLPEDTEQAARKYEEEAVSGGIRYRVSDLTTGEETVLMELTVADDAADDGEGARVADELFRTRIVWQEVTDAPAGTAAAGEESKKVRIIAGQFFRQDLFAPYYENRLYLLEEGGGLLYTYDIPVQERLERVTRGYVNGEEALSLYFETEAPVTIATGSLYESF